MVSQHNPHTPFSLSGANVYKRPCAALLAASLLCVQKIVGGQCKPLSVEIAAQWQENLDVTCGPSPLHNEERNKLHDAPILTFS